MTARKNTDTVRASRTGHSFHEIWTARRILQLVFAQDNLFSVAIEGLSSTEILKIDQAAEEIADLVLYFGKGESIRECDAQQIIQFKYKAGSEAVTSSYLKKTIQKFSRTLQSFKEEIAEQEWIAKLSFGFVTNAAFKNNLLEAIAFLQGGDEPVTREGREQAKNLQRWCGEEGVDAKHLFPLIEFNAGTQNFSSQNHAFRRTISDWSASSSGVAARRLNELKELVRAKAQLEGQGRNSIKREDVLAALECYEDQLFPAESQFIDVGPVIERGELNTVIAALKSSDIPIFLEAAGGVGKTVFVQSLARALTTQYQAVVFDCFGGGSYRISTKRRHHPNVGLIQVINELASQGLCDPLLPSDGDQYALIDYARKRFEQASATVRRQSNLQGILIVIDAADNAQLEADSRNQPAFPSLLLESISSEPLEGVKLLVTARPHRANDVIQKSNVNRIKLAPFTRAETRDFLSTRKAKATNAQISAAYAKSLGNARVLDYLVQSWDENIDGKVTTLTLTAESLIAQRCKKTTRNLETQGWTEQETQQLLAALVLLPPPIPLHRLAEALAWPADQVQSALSDLAPMLEISNQGVIVRDEPTETYIRDTFGQIVDAQEAIANRLMQQQENSVYAAEALPHFLFVTNNRNLAHDLAESTKFPAEMQTDHELRYIRLERLHAAFALAAKEQDYDRALFYSMQLAELAAANSKGADYILWSPALSTLHGNTEVYRQLFNDRSGWKGARDARLVVAHCFLGEYDDAEVHKDRAIGWINWSAQNSSKIQENNHESYGAADIAAIMFLSVLKGEFATLNRNKQFWISKSGAKIFGQLIQLCELHQSATQDKTLENLVEFIASKECESALLKILILSNPLGLPKALLVKVSRSVSSSLKLESEEYGEEFPQTLNEMPLSSASINSLILNSKASAKSILKTRKLKRPSEYTFTNDIDSGNCWAPIEMACASTWSKGKPLTIQHLIPNEVRLTNEAKQVRNTLELKKYLSTLSASTPHHDHLGHRKSQKKPKFSDQDCEAIIDGIDVSLKLSEPIQATILSGGHIGTGTLESFLQIWSSILNRRLHWRYHRHLDPIGKQVGLAFVDLILTHIPSVRQDYAQELLAIIDANRFRFSDKLRILKLLIQHPNLGEVCGQYANQLKQEIIKDEFIEQRGTSYLEVTTALMQLNVDEAKHYYTEGLGQLNQLGGSDYEPLYAMLQFAASKPFGLVSSHAAHRTMGFCQAIFEGEPRKFGWTLFANAAANSFGLSAIYKLLRWHNQDIAEFSYGLPQLACYLAKSRQMDPRRAAIILSIPMEHGWYDWRIGDGLKSIMEVASSEDREQIFSMIVSKLDREHPQGGGTRMWESLLDCAKDFDEIRNGLQLERVHVKSKAAKSREQTEDDIRSYNNYSPTTDFQQRQIKSEEACNKTIFRIRDAYDFSDERALDPAIQEVQLAGGDFSYTKIYELVDELISACPYGKRRKFLEAIIKSKELHFGKLIDILIETYEAWHASSTALKKQGKEIISLLFAFRGSDFFINSYYGLKRIHTLLSEICGEPAHVLHLLLETIAKENIELSANSWIELAEVLAVHAGPETSVKSLEWLLNSPATNVGDEIGEGIYKDAYAGAQTERGVFVDFVWHLLGDRDAFVRWDTARAISSMVSFGLIEDLVSILDFVEIHENPALASEDYHFAFMNAQQWLFMGLSRASLHHGEKMLPLKGRLLELAQDANLHDVNKLHILRCLRHIEDANGQTKEVQLLWHNFQRLTHTLIERDGFPGHVKQKVDFRLDYDFSKYKIYSITELFWMPDSEAKDAIANEILQFWPNVKSTSEIPGIVRYNPDERYEEYPEHIQRHALLHAASNLAKVRPMARASYNASNYNPWMEFLSRYDVSFQDGSWLADYKDEVPSEALQYFLMQTKDRDNDLVDQDTLLHKLGFSAAGEDAFVPIGGRWVSPDGVHVNINSALVETYGAIGKCTQAAKLRYHDLWLPLFDGNGEIDTSFRESPFEPLLCYPENQTIGIDETDQWATRDAKMRPQLGIIHNKHFGLKLDRKMAVWKDEEEQIALRSEVWGQWRRGEDYRSGMHQDEGSILRATEAWLVSKLSQYNKSLVQMITISKYTSDRSYQRTRSMRDVYVVLRRPKKELRLWHAKKASERSLFDY